MRKLTLGVFLIFFGCIGGSAFAQAPAGYYSSTNGQSAETLQVALYYLIKNHIIRTYEALCTDFQFTDFKANGYVWGMYYDFPSGIPPYNLTRSTLQPIGKH